MDFKNMRHKNKKENSLCNSSSVTSEASSFGIEESINDLEIEIYIDNAEEDYSDDQLLMYSHNDVLVNSSANDNQVQSLNASEEQSYESVPIIIGVIQTGNYCDEESDDQINLVDEDEMEDKKHKEYIQLSSGVVKMVAVTDERDNVENYIKCSACDFQISIPKKKDSGGSFLPVASAMMDVKNHCKTSHALHYCYLNNEAESKELEQCKNPEPSQTSGKKQNKRSKTKKDC